MVGDCWNATPAILKPWPWTGTPKVDCASPHTSMTFAVLTTTGTADYSKASKSGTPGGHWSAAHGDTACTYSAARRFLHTDNSTPIFPDITTYGPTEAQYRAGARWLRCDLQFINTRKHLMLVPGNPHDLAFRSGLTFRWCSTSKSQTTPWGKPYSYGTSCTNNAHWLLTKIVPLKTLGTRAQMNRIGHSRCANAGRYFFQWPSRKGWKNGDHDMACWDRMTR